MSIDETRKVLEAYWQDHDPRYVAESAVFTMQATGEEIRGREAIAKHLAGFYHGASRYEGAQDSNRQAHLCTAVFRTGALPIRTSPPSLKVNLR